MAWQKRVADLLTLARLPLALALIVLGIAHGRQGIATALALFLVAVTFDSLDGHLARRSRTKRQTWIGAHDLECDIAFSVAILGYLALAKYVAPLLIAAYFGLWMVIFHGQVTISHTLAVLFQAPAYAGIVVAATFTDAALIIPVAAWLGVMFLLAGQRFLRVRVPAFFGDLFENVIGLTRHRKNIP